LGYSGANFEDLIVDNSANAAFLSPCQKSRTFLARAKKSLPVEGMREVCLAKYDSSLLENLNVSFIE
jgi:hypothetical protein